MNYRLIHGDALAELRELEADSIDSVVTDPPYGLGFMGREWDTFKPSNVAKEMKRDTRTQKRRELYGGRESDAPSAAMAAARYDLSRPANVKFQEWCEAWARECLRVLKPGGHLCAFGGSRTYHRLACAIEDAGFEIRDQLQWLYGSGFPKSLDVSAAIDKHLKAERRFVGTRKVLKGVAFEQSTPYASGRDEIAVTEPATAAAALQGWGTALKPAHEPIVLARKPFRGTVAENVLKYETGALNIDACRIETNEQWDGGGATKPRESGIGFASSSSSSSSHPLGRWPANLLLDEEAAAILDAQSGQLTSGAADILNRNTDKFHNTFSRFEGERVEGATYGDTGGASRFFYTAKADRRQREAGLDSFTARVTDDGRQTPIDNPYLRGETNRRNHHPTVKPVAVMRWLVRLVTPRGGTVLDLFFGSGTTGVAAISEGFDFIGIEREAEYVEIGRARIKNVAPLYATEVTPSDLTEGREG